MLEFLTRLHQLSLQMKDKVEGKGEVEGGSRLDLRTTWMSHRESLRLPRKVETMSNTSVKTSPSGR